MPIIAEGTPNHTLMSAFKRAWVAFLQATREGVDENIREQDEYIVEIKEEILQQATGQQEQTAT